MQVKLGVSHIFARGAVQRHWFSLVFYKFKKSVAKKVAGSAAMARSGGEGYGEGYPPPPPRDS